MSRGMYALRVALPAIIICKPIGLTAKAIESIARKIRLRCVRRMQKVMQDFPQD